jgi:hypothetical protein
MMTAPKPHHVITANDLKDGLVVYQVADDSWTPSVGLAEVIESDDGLEARLACAQKAESDQMVVGPYAVAVDVSGDNPRPTKYRERIRAYGPSTHPAFAHDGPVLDQTNHHAALEGGR